MSALRGAVGFLTRLPVAADESDWVAFAAAPWTFPVIGSLVGGLAALALLLPGVGGAFAFVVAVYALTGVNHADGLADLGDAAVVHGDSERRRAVLKDSDVGVGAVLAVGLGLAGLALAALGLSGIGWARAAALVVVCEVGAKLGMATLACLGSASHEGLAGALTGRCSPDGLAGPVVASVPAVGLAAALGVPVAGLAALLSAVAVAAWLRRWADARLGGVSGDVFGAANELGRVVGLHAGLLLL